MAQQGVTTLTAQKAPSRRNRYGLALMLLLVGGWFALGRDWIGAVAMGVFAVIMLLAGPRPATRQLAAEVSPDRLEIAADRIIALRGSGHGIQLDAAGDRELRLDTVVGEPTLVYTGPDGQVTTMVGLGRFDVDEVVSAVVAHGWQVDRADRSAARPVAVSRTPEHPETVVVLREGGATWAPSQRAVVVGLVVLMAVIVAVAVLGPWSIATALVVGAVAAGVLMAIAALVSTRFARHTVTVGPRRLAVQLGANNPAQVVTRDVVAAAYAGKRWLRLRDAQGKRLIWVPLRPKRDEVLAAFRLHGWPT
jgi:hypothetical protein